jgi:predicted ATPase
LRFDAADGAARAPAGARRVTTDELVDEIFGRCRERIERGERVDVEDVLRAHPDLADALRERFAAARLLDRDGARRRRDDPSALTRVGTALGRYRIETVLGAGGMGTVYLAHAERASDAVAAGAQVALKVFHPHLVLRQRFAERFRREAELGRRVDHPNVVRALEAGETFEADRPVRFLVMEHVEGRTLRDLLAEMERLPEELVRHVGREVAKGLAAIHAAGAIHRDLKPDNVIITKDHVVKVMDLGIARVEDAATLSEPGVFVGSLRYGAPEQFVRGRPVDHRTDLHALGLLLYELATGRHPFCGDEFGEVVKQVIDLRPRRCGELTPQVSPFLEELVAQLLEKDREKRPASAASVAAILTEGENSEWWRRRAAEIRRETKRPLRRIRVPRETALYGRDAELALLRSHYVRATEGDGQVVLLEGEAGIGKSRLVDEFVGALVASGEDVSFLHGSYPPGGAATASGAFISAYREHLGDDESAIRAALPQTPLLAPAFAALLRGDVAPEGSERLTKDSMQTVFVHATRSLAATRTTIVLIDDLHFAPEEGRALFAALALAAPGHRILLLGGARRSLDEKWSASLARFAHTSRIPLPRLGARDLVALLVDALKSRHLAEELAAKIATKSDGNPFFVFEILRGLREGQFLSRRPDGTWITTRAIQEIDVPPSVVEVIQARVSDLDPDDRNALEVASCAGFEFDAGLVGAVLGVAPIPLLQRLGRIEKSHRLVRSVGHRFAFDHHQVQEVLYAGLSAPLREAYHAALADAIEARSGAAAKQPEHLEGALCADLAEHLLAGAQAARALRYLDAALLHLECRWLNDAAVRLAERALAVPGLLAGTARVEMLLRLADRLDLLGRRVPQRAAAEEALALARGAGDQASEARASRSLGHVLLSLSRYAEAQEHLERALALARATGDRRHESPATASLANVFLMLGRFAEAQQQSERHLALMREAQDRLGEAQALASLASALTSLGRPAEARELGERSLAVARELGDRKLEGTALSNLGEALVQLTRVAEAQERYERLFALAREMGDRRCEAVAASGLSNVFYVLGRFTESREHTERVLALAREMGDLELEANAEGNLAIVLWGLGRLDDTRAHLERQLALMREIGSPGGEARAVANLGVALVRLGRSAEALEHHERHLALSRKLGDARGEASATGALGYNLLSLGRHAAARENFARYLALTRESGDRREEGYALAGLALVAHESGDIGLAERLLADSLDVRRALGARRDEAASLAARGAVLASAGRSDAARADLEAALALARELSVPAVELMALTHLATLPGGDVAPALAALAEQRGNVAPLDLAEISFLLWKATHERAHIDEAKRLLDEFVAHAPQECRASMTTDVRLYREIEAAWREEPRQGEAPRRA